MEKLLQEQMFCFQCEQTAGCTGCEHSAGVCGKQASTAQLQDELVGALIALSKTANDKKIKSQEIYKIIIEGLFTTITNVSFNDETLQLIIDNVRKHTDKISGKNSKENKSDRDLEYDMKNLWKEDEDLRSLKSLILFGIKGMAAYAYHAMVLDYVDDEVNQFFVDALEIVGDEESFDDLLKTTLKVGEENLKCMALLDKANTESYGTPTPVTVSLKVEKGPFIVVSGHDLKDLKLLLEQTDGKGVNVYTHGEMLPAHGYPELKKYPHLKGNFGTAWQNQKKEFKDLPAPVLFTTNCLMPPLDNYKDRVFTTEVVSFPGLIHIDDDKDFTPVIEKALELGGYKQDTQFYGINGGDHVTTGFGHGAILSHAGEVVDAVKSGAIKHFFLVGGCDGAKPGRNYYTDFVANSPKDSIILTLACGKYRFNDLDLGTINGLPRIMDIGQCNDAFGAVQVALALAKAFDCEVNDLPLSYIISWYEQKAVAVLLTLLYLGIKNIKLGPTLPAFVSPNVLKFLVDNYGISPITTAQEDLKQILA